jgi:uncharacterized protein (DUF433 family)
MVADGMTVDEILEEHPTVAAEDITEALAQVCSGSAVERRGQTSESVEFWQ